MIIGRYRTPSNFISDIRSFLLSAQNDLAGSFRRAKKLTEEDSDIMERIQNRQDGLEQLLDRFERAIAPGLTA